MKTPTPSYNTIGIGYDGTRKADTYLSNKMFELLNGGKDAQYLDVGCGTGNYTAALHSMGLPFIGIDPSEEMLAKARLKNKGIQWLHGEAEHIDLEAHSIMGVLVSLSIHHWKNLAQGFREISRVLKNNGKVVLFTSLPSQTKNYWLNEYFPKMLEDSIRVLPPLADIQDAFQQANLEIIHQENYTVQVDLQDLFLYCGKHNPEMYFDASIRQGISSFSLLANKAEVEAGLISLRADIDSGKITEIKKKYDAQLGDYIFIVGQKVCND